MTIIYALFLVGSFAVGGLMANHSVNPPTNQRQDRCYGLEEKYCKDYREKYVDKKLIE
jgi:hypothetical protein